MAKRQSHSASHFNPENDVESELNATYDELKKVVGSLDDISSIMHKITSLKNEIEHKERRAETAKENYSVKKGQGLGNTATVVGGPKVGLQQHAGKAMSSLEGLVKQVADEQEILRHRNAEKFVENRHQKAKGPSANTQARAVPTVLAELRKKLTSKAQEDGKMASPPPKTLSQKEKTSVLVKTSPKEPRARMAAKLFQPFDIDRDGTVNHSEFRQGMVSLGFRPDEATALLPVLDPKNTGVIEYGRLHEVEAPPSPPLPPPMSSLSRAESERKPSQQGGTGGGLRFSRSISASDLKISGLGAQRKVPSSLRDQIAKAEDRAKTNALSLRAYLPEDIATQSQSNLSTNDRKAIQTGPEALLLGKLAKGGVGALRSSLRRKDASHSGALGVQELDQGLQKYGVALGPKQIAALAERYRKEGTQTVDYESMIDCLESKLQHTEHKNAGLRAHDLNRRVCRKVSEALAKTSHDKIQELFREWDADGSGGIDRSELGNGMQTLGVPLSSSEVNALVKIADKNGDGVINYEELVHLIEDKRAQFECTDKELRLQQDKSGKVPIHLQSSMVMDNPYLSPSKVPTPMVKKERVTLSRLADMVCSLGEDIKRDLNKTAVKKQGFVSLSDIQKGLKKNGVQMADNDLKTVLAKNGIAGREQIPLGELCSILGLEKEVKSKDPDGGIFQIKETTALSNPTFSTSMFDASSDWMPLKKNKPRMHGEDEVRVSRFFEPSDELEPLMPVSLTGLVRAKSCPPSQHRSRGSLNESSMVTEVLLHVPHTPSARPQMTPSSRQRTMRARTPASEAVRPPPFAVDVRNEPSGSRVKYIASTKPAAEKELNRSVSRSLADHLQHQSGISQNNSVHYLASNNNSSIFHEP